MSRPFAPAWITLGGLLRTVASTELVYLAGCIEYFLFARVEWVAFSTDVDVHRLTSIGGTRYKCVAAAAVDGDIVIFWVDF